MRGRHPEVLAPAALLRGRFKRASKGDGNHIYFFNNAHLLSESGVNACSPGTVPMSL